MATPLFAGTTAGTMSRTGKSRLQTGTKTGVGSIGSGITIGGRSLQLGPGPRICPSEPALCPAYGSSHIEPGCDGTAVLAVVSNLRFGRMTCLT